VKSLPFCLLVVNKWTRTLSVTVTPGKNIFVSFVEDVLRMSSGQFAILGGSRSVCEHNNDINDVDEDDDDDDDDDNQRYL